MVDVSFQISSLLIMRLRGNFCAIVRPNNISMVLELVGTFELAVTQKVLDNIR